MRGVIFMKKIISVIMIMLVLCTGSITAYAGNMIDGLDSTVDISEENQKEIIKYLDEISDYEITENNVEFKKAYKVYVDVPELLDYNEMTEDIIKNLISEKEYCYCVAAHTQDEHITATLNKDSENENYWKVFSAAVDAKMFDYIDSLNISLENNNVTDANVYLLGGVNGNIRTVAAVCRGNGDVQFLILYGSDEEENMYSFTSENSRLYSYDEIKHIASLFVDMPDHDGGGGSDNYLQYALIAGGAVLAAAVAAGIILVVKKRKAKAAAE